MSIFILFYIYFQQMLTDKSDTLQRIVLLETLKVVLVFFHLPGCRYVYVCMYYAIPLTTTAL